MAYQKSARAHVKAGGEDGIVEALVATYDIDSIGDRIMPGAFAKTLDEWAASDNTIPFIWSHLHDDIDAYLGDVLEAREVEKTDDSPGGLYVKAQIDMDDDKSRKAYRLLKGGRVRNYSFAYDVRDSGPADDDENITELRELGLFEVGPTLIGMNRETRTLAVKAGASTVENAVLTLNGKTDASFVMPTMRLKVGALSDDDAKDLRQAGELLAGVLSKLDDDNDDEQQDAEESSQPAEPEKRDERISEKRDEPMQTGTDDDLAARLRLNEMDGV